MYIGQTERNILVRFKERKAHALRNRPEKLALDKHMYDCSVNNTTLKKQVNH